MRARSQNGRVSMNVVDLRIQEPYKKRKTWNVVCDKEDYSYLMGEYSTEEKALKVLKLFDEIHSIRETTVFGFPQDND
ncbi:MAG: hypothetical protein NC310_04470, partial [Roseburia sp.]|nr:hypothetical protein [Anaeroplasma bactoclasticum]MCM1196316.1 hypothetical protein [Roseburia sp.]